MSRGTSAERRSQWGERLQRFAEADLSVVEFVDVNRFRSPPSINGEEN